MEVLGGGTTVISVLQTAWQVIEYVRAVRSAGDAKQKVLVELVRARTLLSSLSEVAENFKNDEWFRALQSLGGPHGVLSEFKGLLEWIMDEIGVPKLQEQKVNPLTPAPRTSGLRQRMRRKFKGKPNAPDISYDQAPNNVGLKGVIKDLLWPFKEAEVQGLLGKLERIKTHLLLAVSSDNVRLSKLIRDQLQSVHGEIRVLREHQEGSQAWTAQQDLIFRSISSVNFSSTRFPDNINELKESASMLLQDHTFAKWLTDDNCDTSLLLSGLPGSGKTSMCRVVEDYLGTLVSNSDTFVVALYFSKNNQEKAQSLQTVLAFVVETMLRQRPQTQKYYNRLMLTGEGPLKVEDSLRIIHRARQDFRSFYVLIDALDECNAQHAQVIVERLTQLRNPLRIFATSRRNPLSAHFSNSIEMEQLNHNWIRKYIRESLAVKVPDVLDADSATFQRLTENIFTRSEGRFTAAKLLITQLQDNASAQDISRTMPSQPSSIEQIYARIIKRMNEQMQGNAALGRRVLSELLVTPGAMTAVMLLDAIASDTGWEKTCDQAQIDKRINHCVQCCMGLVVHSGDIVGFCHLTVKEYLEAHGVPNEAQP